MLDTSKISLWVMLPERTWRSSTEAGVPKVEGRAYDGVMFKVVMLVALVILLGDLIRRARLRRELDHTWRRENEEFLRRLREHADQS